MLIRILLLRCPDCGRGSIFRAPFRQRPLCTECNCSFHPEPGFSLGAIQLNIVINEFLVTIIFFSLYVTEALEWRTLLIVCLGLALTLPLVFYHHARSLWLAVTRLLDRAP